MAKVRPTRSALVDKLVGKNVLLYINYGEGATESAPVWTLIGGQRSASLSMTADDIDATNKGSDGWGEVYAGIKSTQLSFEGIINKNDDGYAALKDAYIKGEAVDLCRYATDGTAERNWYNITELSDEAPYNDMATFSCSAGGVGKPRFYSGLTSINDVAGLISDDSESRVTISKTDPEDVVVTITQGNIVGLKNGSSDVASTNYTIAAGAKSIVILADYLATLSTGEQTFTILLDNELNITYVVTIVA